MQNYKVEKSSKQDLIKLLQLVKQHVKRRYINTRSEQQRSAQHHVTAGLLTSAGKPDLYSI